MKKFRAYLKLDFGQPIYGKIREFEDNTSKEEIEDTMAEDADNLMFDLCSNRHFDKVDD